jgi:uncharacterized alkaline shock family protein YloU
VSEAERRQAQSPLLSERGVTTIKDSVVSRIAGIAAREVEGVHMGGSVSRTASGVLGNLTGSDSQTRGISVNVGRIEAAIDLTMGIDYGRNFVQTVEEVRSRITERVESMTGLRVVECNATISEVIFPNDGDGRRGELEAGAADAPPESRAMPESYYTEEASPASQTREESQSGPVAEEEVRAEGQPVEEDETAVLRTGEEETAAEEKSAAEDETREFARGPLAEDERDRGGRREES